VVLAAASGTGKTTLAHMLLQNDSALRLSISYTTRPLRGEEENGRDYHFVDDSAFKQMIENDSLIEWAEVHGHYYGSSAEKTQELMGQGWDVLFDIDVQGGLQLKQRFPETLLIYLVPPSMKILKERLTRRGTDSADVIERRLKAASQENEVGLRDFDYIITNDQLDRALFDITAIVRAHRLRHLDRGKIQNQLDGD
jgi:guanylate kinase